MRIWDAVKNMWNETASAVRSEVTQLEINHAASVLGADEEIRHEPVYNHVTGVESMQPVKRKKSEINLGWLVPVAFMLLSSLCVQPAYAQTSCATPLQTVQSQRGSDDNLYALWCWDPVNHAITFPGLAGGFTFPNGGLITSVTDSYAFGPEDLCALTPATTAFTAGPAIVRAAANNLVLQGTTNVTAGTITVTCDIGELLSRTTTGKGATLKSVDLYYGVQTTALASIAAATPATVTYPAAGAAAAGTVASIGGSLTVTPGTLQLATTPSGQCYHENIAFGTNFVYNSAVAKLTLEQAFTTTAGTATVFQICGVGVAFNYAY